LVQGIKAKRYTCVITLQFPSVTSHQSIKTTYKSQYVYLNIFPPLLQHSAFVSHFLGKIHGLLHHTDHRTWGRKSYL